MKKLAAHNRICIMEIPGKVGWPVVGDKSVEFYRDPLKFLSKRMDDANSKIFVARFLNKPTVFVCSNDAVSDVLNDPENALELGYESFMGQIYGHNLLFSSNDFAQEFRRTLGLLFATDTLDSYSSIITQILEKKIPHLNHKEPVCPYKMFKEIFTEMCLSLFLGLDFTESEDIAQTIVGLTITHWHGIIAVPLEIKIPGVRKSSTYSKALEAKTRLLEVIANQREKVRCGFALRMQKITGMDDITINNHLLLFTSALVPKVLASICTSFCAEIGGPEMTFYQNVAKADPTILDNLLLECQRLYPPLLGGRRLARKTCTIGGYKVPKDYAVVYMTHSAQRDPNVFIEPEMFIPQRWNNNLELRNKLFVFGKGRRGCVGQQLAWLMLTSTLSSLIDNYNWEVCPSQDMACKYIPVRRPKSDIMAKLTPRIPDNTNRGSDIIGVGDGDSVEDQNDNTVSKDQV